MVDGEVFVTSPFFFYSVIFLLGILKCIECPGPEELNLARRVRSDAQAVRFAIAENDCALSRRQYLG